MREPKMIAACGLDCGSCSIRRLPFDAEAAVEAIGWYRQQGWLKEDEGVAEAIERKMFCCGCHSDREAHWSADCWILHCCVDANSLEHCCDCATFPCDRLVEWSRSDESYGKAFDRLRRMQAERGGTPRRRGARDRRIEGA